MELILRRIKNLSLLVMSLLFLSACGGAPGTAGTTDDPDDPDTPVQLVSEIVLTLGATSLVANGTDTVAVRATVNDQDGAAISGATVSFGSSLGDLSSATASTNINGVAQVTLTAGTVSGTANITISASGFNASGSVDFTSTSTDLIVGGVTLTLGASSVTANGSDSLAVRATVVDQDGSPLSGASVSFSASSGTLTAATATTDSSGGAQVSLVSSTLTGVSLVSVSVSGFSDSGSVSFVPGPAANVVVQASSTSVLSAGTSDISAIVTDANGNAVTGETVTFSFTAQGSGSPSLSSITAQTNSNGIATSTYTAGNSVGTDTISAGTSSNASGTANITVTAGSVIVGSIDLTLGAASIVANGSDSIAVRATVTDQDGDPLSGASVSFSASSGTLTAATATTDSSGVAQVSLVSGTLTGVSLVSVSVSGFSDNGSVSFVPGPAAGLVIQASSTSVLSAGTSDISAIVTDANGNAVTNETVTFSFTSQGSGTPSLSPITAQTNSNGIATSTYTAGNSVGTDTITAGTSSNASDTENIVVTAASVIVGAVDLTLGAASIVANGSDSIAVRATVTDQDGDPFPGVTVSFSASSGTLSAASLATDSLGVAQVSLESGTLTGASLVTVSASGFSDNGSVSFVPGPAANVTIQASPASVLSSGTSSVSASVTDANGNTVTGETVTFSFDAEGSGTPSLSSINAQTNSNGVASSTYTAGSSVGTDTIAAGTSSGASGTADITVTAAAVVVSSIDLTAGASSLVADGATGAAIRAEVLDIDSNPVEGEVVSFSSTAGTLSSATATTDSNGLAQITLTSSTTPETALVNATISGFADEVTVPFVAGPPSTSSSVISGNPSSIPADGASTSDITVLLIDDNGNLVTDGTQVTLQTTAGTITSSSTASTSSGRASFTLQASSTSETANLSITQYSGITGSIEFGATGTGTATSVSTTISNNFLTISGVGGVDNTTITVTVTDDSGGLISDPANDNVRVSFITKPGGSEFISVDGVTSTTTIDAQTESGSVTFNLQAGNLPGAVELQIEVDSTGVFSSPEVTTLIPQISIASGPPDTIVLSTPITNSVENIGGGFYRRRGTLIVTDRFGNAVPDGTAINLGIVDSVIVDSNSGQLTGSTLTDTAATFSDGSAIAAFSSASIVRNSSNRFIEQNDRVLVTDVVDAADKARFVGASVNLTDLDVQADFVGTDTGLDYVIGAAMLGAEIAGIDSSNNLTTGSVSTESGLANIRVTYPANTGTIRVGCFNAALDTRYAPTSSARVFMVASATSGSATLVDEGTMCFTPIAGFTLESAVSSVSGSATVGMTLRDGGDTIPLPFFPISCSVEIQTDGDGDLSVTASSGSTDVNGNYSTTITVANQDSNDRARVTCFDGAGEDSVQISVSIP